MEKRKSKFALSKNPIIRKAPNSISSAFKRRVIENSEENYQQNNRTGLRYFLVPLCSSINEFS